MVKPWALLDFQLTLPFPGVWAWAHSLLQVTLFSDNNYLYFKSYIFPSFNDFLVIRNNFGKKRVNWNLKPQASVYHWEEVRAAKHASLATPHTQLRETNEQSLPTEWPTNMVWNVWDWGPPHTLGSDAHLPTQGWKESSWEHACSSVLPHQGRSRIGCARNARAGEHGGFPSPYTEIFPGHTVCCMAYLAIIQIKRVYVLHTHSQS